MKVEEKEEVELGAGLIFFGEVITVVVRKHNELSEGGHMLIEAMACCRADKVERRVRF